MIRKVLARSLAVGVLTVGTAFGSAVIGEPVASAACQFGGGGARTVWAGGEAGNCDVDEWNNGPIVAHWCEPWSTDIVVAYWFGCTDRFANGMQRWCTGGGGGLGYAGGEGGRCDDPYWP